MNLVDLMVRTPSLAYDDNYVRVHYVRYADDFIIGVEGSLTKTKAIKAEVTEFITDSLGLKLNESKTGIVSFTEEPCDFLGYQFRAPYKKGSSRGLIPIKETNSGREVRRRRKERISIYVNYGKVLKKLETNGFITKRIIPGTNDKIGYRGTFRGNLVNLDHADILRYYNAVIRGVYNYYCFVNNMSNLAQII
jgi:hypothetical protein